MSAATTLQTRTPLDALIDKLRDGRRLPTLGLTVTRILQLARSADGSIAELAHLILADVYLTQRVLTLANAAIYRRSYSQPVTTITRAIVLLGFDQVRLLALGVLLLDDVDDPQQSRALRAELVNAACASQVACELADRRMERVREEASIAALFANFGRLIVGAFHFEAYRRITLRVQRGEREEAAAIAELGTGYRALTSAVLDDMGVPASLVGAIESASAGPAPPKAGETPTLAHLVDCAGAIADGIVAADPAARERQLARIAATYGKAFGVDRDALDGLVLATLEGMAPLQRAILEATDPLSRLGVGPAAPADDDDERAGDDEDARDEVDADSDDERGACTLSEQARERVAKTTDGLRTRVAQGESLTTVLRESLDAMRVAYGFERMVLMLRDASPGGGLQARIASGHLPAPMLAAMRCTLDSAADLVGLATARAVDLQLRDLDERRLAGRLPRWQPRLVPRAKSAVLLPLVHQGKPIGCLYADHAGPQPRALASDDLAALKRFKHQVVASLRTVRV